MTLFTDEAIVAITDFIQSNGSDLYRVSYQLATAHVFSTHMEMSENVFD
jgi:hypothetical protein